MLGVVDMGGGERGVYGAGVLVAVGSGVGVSVAAGTGVGVSAVSGENV